MECEATCLYLLMCFVPQFPEATDNNPRKCDISNEILRATSSNNIF